MKKENKPVSPFSSAPFFTGDTMYVPVTESGLEGEGFLTPQEFMRQSHKLSDKELNRIIYGQCVAMVKAGKMPPWPEDDAQIVSWFAWNFITPEMREVFPAIAKEYLAHEKLIGTEFEDVPYPLMNENTWEDALYFRLLMMMVQAARKGSSYSKNFLLSLYKVYYKQEYNRLKGKKILTWLDVLEIHDENCKRQGLASGHTTDGGKSFRDKVIEERMHEAGWTNVYGTRKLDPTPKSPSNGLEEDIEKELEDAAITIKSLNNAPDEPPLQPVSARLFLMAELLHIEIDATCNAEAAAMTVALEDIQKFNFLSSPDYRRARKDIIEHYKGILHAKKPETADPFLYQTNKDYLALELAEQTAFSVFRTLDRNPRLIYDSREFKLDEIIGDVMLQLQVNFPDYKPTYSEVQFLAMVHYLSTCLCDLMFTRDNQLDELLHFHRRYFKGEWSKEVQEARNDVRADKLIKTVQNLREKEEKEALAKEETPLDEAGLRAEVERLKAQLDEKEFALAEAEQKAIRQRMLYEKAHENELKLEADKEDAATEHAELIALREYVYNLRDEKEPELDEATQAELIKAVQDKNVAILGGTERWIKRMKRLYPNWKFISVEDDSLGGYNMLESADYIYIYTSALKHKQYYRAMNLIRSKGKQLFYLGSTNTAENVMRFYRDLCK